MTLIEVFGHCYSPHAMSFHLFIELLTFCHVFVLLFDPEITVSDPPLVPPAFFPIFHRYAVFTSRQHMSRIHRPEKEIGFGILARRDQNNAIEC